MALRDEQITQGLELSAQLEDLPLVNDGHMDQFVRVYERRFQRGLYAYYRGDYSKALHDFEHACKIASEQNDHKRYVSACIYLLRILAEREEFAKISRIETTMLKILSSSEAINLDLKLKSQAHYVLGICSCYQPSCYDLALQRFREAVDFAMMSEDRAALVAPLYGAATVHYAAKRNDEAIRELDRLDVLLSCLHLPDMSSAASVLRALVLRNQGLLEAALDSAWTAFESLKHHPHLVLYLHTLCVLGMLFHLKGDGNSARVYLDLADRSLKREEFPRISRLVDESMESLGQGPAVGTADLIFETRTGVLIEKNKGEIRFDGQFILRDLLRAFLEHPGRAFSKEELVRDVWHESYDPRIHDNKIYVTIKRLRGLLESETGTSDYILRVKSGYCLNPKTRVLINRHQPPMETTT
jgi:DNA-binding winged helix-turn-helix (wHTH) protein/tetratricopeptide (TPR) repeat protein